MLLSASGMMTDLAILLIPAVDIPMGPTDTISGIHTLSTIVNSSWFFIPVICQNN